MELYAVITHAAEWMNLGHVHDFFRRTADMNEFAKNPCSLSCGILMHAPCP